MKAGRIPAIVTLLLSFFILPDFAQAKYSGGSGTPGDPYKIGSAADLLALASNTDDYSANFILTADIDLGSSGIFTTAVIAISGTGGFRGVFNGNDHKISNLTINSANAGNSYLGLFGTINGGEIKNLGLENVSVTGGNGSSYVGGLVGGSTGSISNCFSTGSVSSGEYVGGLVGQNYGSIDHCYSIVVVNGCAYAGGLVGRNWSEGSISQCYSTGTVTCGVSWGQYLGGLVGENNGSMNNCYSIGAVTVVDGAWLGGLAGNQQGGDISNCYATGIITPWAMFGGGLVGCRTTTGNISHSYFLNTSGPNNGRGTPLTNTQMKQQASFVGWDFIGESTNGTDDIWSIIEGVSYPELAWQYTLPDLVITSSIVVSPIPVIVGNNLMVTYTVKNIGNGAANESQTRIQLKLGSSSTAVTEIFHTTPFLTAGSSTTEDVIVPIPSSLAAGNYTVYITLDYNKVIGQSNTNNDVYQTPIGALIIQTSPVTPSKAIVWVYINEPNGFTGKMSTYETTNAQYCEFLNSAKTSGDITVSGNYVIGASGPYVGQNYYDLNGQGFTFVGAINGGASRIHYTGTLFTVDSGFENHPVTHVSWYGAMAFCDYYGYRLPTYGEWVSVADYDSSYIYGCGVSINPSIANYDDSIHPYGTTAVGTFGNFGYGLCDMAGNVWEMTSNCYYPDCSGSYHISLGGTWCNVPSFCRFRDSLSYTPANNVLCYDVGFRVVREIGPSGTPPSQNYFFGNQDQRSGTSNDPVNTATGNFFHQETDLSIQTRAIPIMFLRTYNSKDLRYSSLGQGWTHSYYVILRQEPNNLVSVRWGDGKTDYWNLNGSTYEPNTMGLYDKLVKNIDNTWDVTRKNLDVYHFDSSNRLVSIMDKNGNAVTLAYNHPTDTNLVTSIADPAGRTVTLTYNPQGQLSNITDIATPARIVSYTYTSGRLTQVTDVMGNTIQYGYDSNGLLTTITDQRGVVTITNIYDVNDRVIQQCDGRNNLTTFTYDSPGLGQTTITDANSQSTIHVHSGGYKLLDSIIDPCGNSILYAYDANCNRTAITDRNGNTTAFVYDSQGNVIRTFTPDGGVTAVDYNNPNFPDFPTKKTDVLGNITRWEYDSKGNVIHQIDPNGNQRVWTYNSFGQKLTETDENTNTTSYIYNTDGLLTEVIDPNGNHTWYGYDTLWRLTHTTDSRGSGAGDPAHTTITAYDNADRVTSITGPITTESYQYDNVGNRTGVTNKRGYTTVYHYDNNNNLTRIERPAPSGQTQITQYTYDELNRKVSTTDPNGNLTNYQYDAAGRLLKETNPEGNETTYTYDPHGNVLSVTDGGGVTTYYGYDSMNLKSHRYDELDHHWYWQYDKLGRLTRQTDPKGYKTTYEYDILGRLARVIDDVNNATQYKYDSVGNLVEVIDATGITIDKRFYDIANRLTRKEDALGNAYEYTYDGASNMLSRRDAENNFTTYSYDSENRLIEVNYPDSNKVTYTYDNNRNPINMTDKIGTTAYTYDALDRLTFSTDPFGKTVQYGYDIVGNRTSITYPADSTNPARTVTYRYDRANRLDKIIDWAGRTWDYNTDGAGRIIDVNIPNGLRELRTYDTAGRLSTLRYKDINDANIITYTYTRDAQGNPTNITETGTLQPVINLSLKRDYTYDEDNRLVETTRPSTYNHDDNGNMISRTYAGLFSTFFTYDYENRLSSQTSGGSTVQHIYDGKGNRISRNDKGTVTRYVLDHGRGMSHILCETDANGAITAYYIHGPQIAARAAINGTIRYYHTDQIGNVVAMSDESHTITDRYAYTPFGMPAGHEGITPNPFTFVGGLGVMTDADGLYFMRARFYDPQTGRFLSKDPIEGTLTEPSGLHRYVYGLDNPIVNIDPKGEVVPVVIAYYAFQYYTLVEQGALREYVNPALAGITGDYPSTNILENAVEEGIGFIPGYQTFKAITYIERIASETLAKITSQLAKTNETSNETELTIINTPGCAPPPAISKTAGKAVMQPSGSVTTSTYQSNVPYIAQTNVSQYVGAVKK